MSNEEKKEFTVKDRRIFSEENKDKKEEKDEAKPSEKRPADQPSKDSGSMGETKAKTEVPMPEISFGTFVFSLNSSAYVHLGLIEDPVSKQKSKNLPLAKQTIDILSMLEEKTSGNLTKEEEGLIKNILYDLRMAYVREKQ